MRKPTPADLLAARDTTVPDVIARGLRVLFCGINPSLYSAAVGLHFARPGNRFWPTLHAAGFTPRRLRPDEGATLLALGYGITNVIDRATARADELTPAEVVAGGVSLARKAKRFKPQVLAVLGVTVYRQAFDRPKAVIGPQPDRMGGTRVWVLPNPSGLNRIATIKLAEHYRELCEAVVGGKMRKDKGDNSKRPG